MILARSEDAALEAAAHTLGEANAKSTPEDLFVPRVPVGIRELLETRVANSSASMESLRQRLCGERRDRAPSIVELAPVQVFNADRIAQQRAISGMIDPGMLVTGAVEELAAVPLSLSALYALSAGAPADEVVAGVRTCLGRVLRND
jgi:hypothetical protein